MITISVNTVGQAGLEGGVSASCFLGHQRESGVSRVCVLSRFSHVRLCNPMGCRLPGCSVHGILQSRILEWVAMASLRDLRDPGIKPMSLTSPELVSRFFNTNATWEASGVSHGSTNLC